MKWIAGITIYILLATFTAAGINADLQAQFGCRLPGDYRKNLAFAIGWSILPGAAIVAPFVTGFYEHGWSFARAKCEAPR